MFLVAFVDAHSINPTMDRVSRFSEPRSVGARGSPGLTTLGVTAPIYAVCTSGRAGIRPVAVSPCSGSGSGSGSGIWSFSTSTGPNALAGGWAAWTPGQALVVVTHHVVGGWVSW